MRCILLLLLCFTSCTTKLAKFPEFKSEIIDSKDLEHHISQISLLKYPTQFRLLTGIKIYKKKKLINSFREVIVLKEPYSLSLESMPDNAFYTINRLEVDKEKYHYIDNIEQKDESGKYYEKLLWDYFYLPFTVEELLNFIFAQVPDVNLETHVLLAQDQGESLIFRNSSFKKPI